jgi:predicted unusual protein kinase regulating ubiquinone biosynthesis (AarF/ABC1/UbiB family)
MAYELRDIIYEFPFQIPIDYVLLARALGILEGLCAGLDPDFNGFVVAEPYVKQLMTMELAGESTADRVISEIQSFATLVWQLPRDLERFLSETARGELEVRVAPTKELDRLVGRLEHAVGRLIDVIAFASFLLAGVLLFLGGWRELGWFFLAMAFLVAVYLVLRR